MRSPYKIGLIFILIASLFTACNILNNFPDEPFKGPSWDLPIRKIPIIPSRKFTVKELVPDLIGEDQDDDEVISIDFAGYESIADFEIPSPSVSVNSQSEDLPLIDLANLNFDGLPDIPGVPDFRDWFDNDLGGEIGDLPLVEVEIDGLEKLTVDQGEIEITITNKSAMVDGPYEFDPSITVPYEYSLDIESVRFTLYGIVDGLEEELGSIEIEDIKEDETKSGTLSLNGKDISTSFRVEFECIRTFINANPKSYYCNADFSVRVDSIKEATIDLTRFDMGDDFDTSFPDMELDLDLDSLIDEDILDMIRNSIGLHADAVHFNLIASNPLDIDLSNDLVIKALDSNGTLLDEKTISLTLAANSENALVPIEGIASLINHFPSSLMIEGFDLLENIGLVKIVPGERFKLEAEFGLKLILTLASDGFEFKIDPIESDISDVFNDLEGIAINSTTLEINFTNHLPFGLEVDLYFSSQSDPYTDDDAIIRTIALPEPQTDNTGKVIEASSQTSTIKVDETFFDLIQAPFYVGLVLKIPNSSAGEKIIALYPNDWIEFSIGADLEIRVNPHDE